MDKEGTTAYATQTDNLNLAAWLVANGVPIADRKTVTVTRLDSSTAHDTTRGAWAFEQSDVTGRVQTVDLIAAFKLPQGATSDPSQIYYLACHNWLCLKSSITQGASLFYTYLTGRDGLIRLSNRQGTPLQKGTLSAGTSSLILAAICITLGVLPLSYSFNLSRLYIQLPGEHETVKAAHWILTHIEETRADDMSLLTLLCTAFYNREELKKAVYRPQEQMAVKVAGQTAFISKNADQALVDKVAAKLSI